ncbi:SWIM zinc finger family protein [Paenibacillus contaminans]|uniref:SWIM-type domain-containing protein n=1 Tax=Paenibacillus contaminans TaxID=450362 RepID=A0A329LXM7_9BACL|nr:SWIM zinc finger family protein [Paenibacillus contaminans]RAV12484.1 hypothetical protein DQG23_34715 [Paenibacillus contaminans]
MLKLKLPVNRINYLADEIRSRFSPGVLERGWLYYHKGRVKELELEGGTELRARVRGSEWYRVVVNLESFARSTCECPADGWCQHIAAVFFQTYESHGRPELMLRQLQLAIQTRARNSKSAAAKLRKEAERRSAIELGDGPKEWQRFFEQRFHGYSLGSPQAVEEFYDMAVSSLEKLAEDWDPRIKPLYSLHVLLFILRKVEQLHEDSQSTYLSYYVGVGSAAVSERCREAIAGLASENEPSPIRKAYPKHWEETIAFSAETMLTGKAGPIDWLDLYRLLWWRWFGDGGGEGSAVREERTRLTLLLGRQGLTPRRKDTLLLALTHFDLMNGEDEQAMRQLNELQAKKVGDFRIVLQHLTNEGAWTRLTAWLRWLLPETVKARQDEFVMICGFWQSAAPHLESDEEWVRIMLSLLPRSYPFYAGYLMQSGRIKQWVDLQLSLNVLPNRLNAIDLKTVEHEDPALLLPLFHQAVERSILEKNRTSYKTAVKLLRKLQTIYKKLNRLDRWEDFLQRLAVKYSRLRAFQEELKKGKWLT